MSYEKKLVYVGVDKLSKEGVAVSEKDIVGRSQGVEKVSMGGGGLNVWLLITFILVLTGVILRLWHLSSQIPLDDEWHALNFVINRSFTDVLLQQGLGANSIPVNVYAWLVLHTTGWSELLLRFPSIVAGVAALIVIPLLARNIWGNPVACVTTALLAVSPLVIFYSRVMRPYAPVMLLAMASILLTLLWQKDGRRRNLLLSALCGSLAIYYHLYAAIPVGVPLCVTFVAALKPLGRRLGLTLKSTTPFTDIFMAGGIMAVVDGVLVVVPNVLNPWWSRGIHNIDRADLDTVVTVLSHISGTRNPLLMAVVVGLMVVGLAVMIHRSRVAGVTVAATFFIFILVMAMTTQDGSHAGIQIARYGITYFPLAFVTMAVALVWIGEALGAKFRLFQRKHMLLYAAMIAWLPFIATSPLWTTYAAPNSFTNHSAYQYRYEPIQWLERSPERDLMPGISMEYGNVPQFYLQSPLLKASKGIIEYPVMIGDQMNLYYYYQHFHRLPVVAGFTSNNLSVPVMPGRDFVYGDWSFDSVMTGMPERHRRKASWHTMADLNDAEVLRKRFKGWTVIIHRNPLREVLRNDSPDNQMSLALPEVMAGSFGDPVYADEQIAAWMIE